MLKPFLLLPSTSKSHAIRDGWRERCGDQVDTLSRLRSAAPGNLVRPQTKACVAT